MINNKFKKRIKIIGIMLITAVLSSCAGTYWVGDGYYGYGVVDTDVYFVRSGYSDWNRAYEWNSAYRNNGWGYYYQPGFGYYRWSRY